MYLNRRRLLPLAGLLLAGCGETTADPSTTAATPDVADTAGTVGEPDTSTANDPHTHVVPSGAPVESLSSRVKARGGEVLATDLAAALELPRASLCLELGLYDCVTDIHRIALGGVEPYELSIRSPLPVAPATAPIALDRLTLTACTERARLDFEAGAGGDGVFASIAKKGAAATRDDRLAVAKALIERLLRREVAEGEAELIADFHEEVAADASSSDHLRDWAVGACFAVASHLEAVFY